MVKYKNFGAVVASSSNASSQGAGTQHSTRTATTTHRSGDRKTAPNEEMVSVSRNGNKGILHRTDLGNASHREDAAYDEDHHGPVFEEREPSARSRHYYQNRTHDAGSMASSTTNTQSVSSSRRTGKLAYVGYVPLNEQSNAEHSIRQKNNILNDSNHTGSTGQVTYPSIKVDDTSTSRRRQNQDVIDMAETDREVASITKAESDTSSTHVLPAHSREPRSEVSPDTTTTSAKEKTTIANSIHNLDDYVETDEKAMEAQRLRRQRLAKKYGTDVSGTTDQDQCRYTSPQRTRYDPDTHLSPTSPKTPTASAAPSREAVTPTTPGSARGSRLARIMRKAQQNQKAIASQLAGNQQFQPQGTHILQQVDGMNAAVANAARMARSEEELPTSPMLLSPPGRGPQFNTMLGLSPKQVSQQPPRMAAGLSPHRQPHAHQKQQLQRQQRNMQAMNFPDSIVPPSLGHGMQQQLQQQFHRTPQSFGLYQTQQIFRQQPYGHAPQQAGPFHQFNPSPASSFHLRQQQQQQDHLARSNRDFPYHYSMHQQYPTGALEDRDGVATSAASMHIASSEWTAAAEENQEGMFCGPDGPKLSNVQFVRGGNGAKKFCEPIGAKCGALMADFLNTCGALSRGAYHTESERSQFEKAARNSIANLTDALGPHWQNYSAFVSQESDIASDGDDEDNAMDRDDSFVASAQRFLQAGNDIMGNLPNEFQNLTESASKQGGRGMKDMRHLFDTFQRYYQPGEALYEEEKEFQTSMPLEVAQMYNPAAYHQYPMPVPPTSGLMGEYQGIYQGQHEAPMQYTASRLELQQNHEEQNESLAPHAPKSPVKNGQNKSKTESFTQEKLDAMTGIRRRRHRAFPYTSSPEHDDSKDEKPKNDTVIDKSYDKSRVRHFYRNLNDRIQKDDSSASLKQAIEAGKEKAKVDNDMEKVIEKTPASPKKEKSEEHKVVMKAQETAQKAHYGEKKDVTDPSDETLKDSARSSDRTEVSEDGFESAHEPSKSGRSESLRSEMSFKTAHIHSASISMHKTASRFVDENLEETIVETVESEDKEEPTSKSSIQQDTTVESADETEMLKVEETEAPQRKMTPSPTPSDEPFDEQKGQQNDEEDLREDCPEDKGNEAFSTSSGNEQISSPLTSSSGMSDSLVGSDEDASHSASPVPCQEPPFVSECTPHEDDEMMMASFEESPMVMQCKPLLELNDKDAHDLEYPDDSFSEHDTEFPHTPLDVIEEEESTAEDLESRDTFCCASSELLPDQNTCEDEDFDIFSLQQHTATQDSASMDEIDQSHHTGHTHSNPVLEGTNTFAAAEASPATAAANIFLKFIFTGMMIYYIGFIFNVWDAAAEMGGHAAQVHAKDVVRPTTTTRTNMDHDHDRIELNRLVEEALEASLSAVNVDIPAVPTISPKNEWEQELKEALEKEELLDRVKRMIRHSSRFEDYNDVDEEELANEIYAIRKSRQTQNEEIQEKNDQDAESEF